MAARFKVECAFPASSGPLSPASLLKGTLKANLGRHLRRPGLAASFFQRTRTQRPPGTSQQNLASQRTLAYAADESRGSRSLGHSARCQPRPPARPRPPCAFLPEPGPAHQPLHPRSCLRGMAGFSWKTQELSRRSRLRTLWLCPLRRVLPAGSCPSHTIQAQSPPGGVQFQVSN